jgi:hypothetical protein
MGRQGDGDGYGAGPFDGVRFSPNCLIISLSSHALYETQLKKIIIRTLLFYLIRKIPLEGMCAL